jgi:hypothetical protein
MVMSLTSKHTIFLEPSRQHRDHNRKRSLREDVKAQLPYKVNTSYGGNIENCAVLCENSERLATFGDKTFEDVNEFVYLDPL